MAIPWKTIERVDTEEGVLELRRHGQGDFLITVAGRVLMNSASHRTEAALGRLACRHIEARPAPRVLVGGLGMGFTLRAVLDVLPAPARVTVAEVNPVVVSWCRGPLSELTGGAAVDSRVRIEIEDVARVVRHWAEKKGPGTIDAVIYDLYTGPYTRTHKKGDPLYGNRAIESVRTVLSPGGIFAVWGEDYDGGFVNRMEAGGFATTVRRPKKGGPRHVIYLGTRPNA
ncbi:MAG: spermidine synthase [Desulfobacterales bacterium]|nr:spermidine synthase [Desulfobacterales bacterium]